MKKYETIFILDPDLEEGQAQSAIEKAVLSPRSAAPPATAANISAVAPLLATNMASGDQEREVAGRTLRQALVAEVVERLGIAEESLQVRFRPQDEKFLSAREPASRFEIDPVRRDRVKKRIDIVWAAPVSRSAVPEPLLKRKKPAGSLPARDFWGGRPPSRTASTHRGTAVVAVATSTSGASSKISNHPWLPEPRPATISARPSPSRSPTAGNTVPFEAL